MVLDALVNPKTGVLKSLDEVEAIGHRVLHGGSKITQSVIINDEVISVIDECCDLRTAAQSGKPDGYPCMYGADAGQAERSSI